MKELISEDTVQKIRLLENSVGQNPTVLASAICATRWGNSYWDGQCFLDASSKNLLENVNAVGLSCYEDGRRSIRGTDYYWLHVLSPLAAYRRTNGMLNVMISIIALDPGIKPYELRRHLKPNFEQSFWYSIGGDRLQDFISGTVDEGEYESDVLGLYALEEYAHDTSITLSALIENARERSACVSNGRFKESEYYKLAEQHVNPRFGHILLRALSGTMPFLCSSGVIPTEEFP